MRRTKTKVWLTSVTILSLTVLGLQTIVPFDVVELVADPNLAIAIDSHPNHPFAHSIRRRAAYVGSTVLSVDNRA